jgi:hypothetical protein
VSLSESMWMEAAPFRAHVQHLMAVADLPVSAVAVLTEVPARVLHQLVGSGGRRTSRRIHHEHATALYAVTPQTVRQLRHQRVGAAQTWSHLRRLRTEGWSDGELAQSLGLSLEELRSLVRLRTRRCTALTALLAAALIAEWESEGYARSARAA